MDSIDKINAFLAIRGWSGADLERAIGASHSVYSQWNTRQTKPSNRSLVKVAKALGVDIAEVLPDKEDTKNGHKNTATTNSDGNSPSDIELLNAFKSSDEATQELIRRVLGLQ